MSQPSLSRVNIKDTFCIALIALANGFKAFGGVCRLALHSNVKEQKKISSQGSSPCLVDDSGIIRFPAKPVNNYFKNYFPDGNRRFDGSVYMT